MSTRKTASNLPLVRSARGRVTESYKEVSVLAGFMDDAFFRAFAQDHLLSVDRGEVQELLDAAEDARRFVAGLEETDLSHVETRPVDGRTAARIENDETFRSAYSGVPHRLSWIDPSKLVALQVSRQVGNECVPTDYQGIIDYALPTDWTLPAEISYVPPFGPIYLISNSPQLSGIQLSIDRMTGQILLGPNLQINLIQVVHFQGRWYLRNGYHRVVAAIEAGLSEIPALVVDAQTAAEVELTNLGLAGLSLSTSIGMRRPALVTDFASDASVVILMREKRYGACVSLQVTPINIPV